MIEKELPTKIRLFPARSLVESGMIFARVIKGERTIGRLAKKQLLEEVRGKVFPGNSQQMEEGSEIFKQKLMDFRLRMTGALSLYSHFTQIPYKDLRKEGNLDSFYLFWFLGAAQDDLIDNEFTNNNSSQQRKNGRDVRELIFNPDREFLRSAFNVLEGKIEKSSLGDKQKEYLSGKIMSWYEFVSSQEDGVASMPLEDYTFAFSRSYRESQNQCAAEVLVALLNWDKCLDHPMQRLELVIPQFSFLTQIIDDVIDVGEDLKAKRPSFAVGALVDHPKELEAFRRTLGDEKRKMRHSSIKKVAPRSYAQICSVFAEYSGNIQSGAGVESEGLLFSANKLLMFVPSLEVLLSEIRSNATFF